MIIGNIISGEFDKAENQFSLQQVKHFTTETTINEEQLNTLYHYLIKHQDDKEGHIITLYDQLPLKLSQIEVELFIRDLEKIQSKYF